MTEATRRGTLQAGLVAGGGLLFTTAVPALIGPGRAFAQAEGDAAILQAAIGLEQTAVTAYETAVAGGLLDREVMGFMRVVARHEQEHADALIAALEDLGGNAPEPLEPEDIDGLGEIRSQDDVLNFALELETMAVAQYYDAQQKLQDPRLLQTGAGIMASEGQHLVVLRQALGLEPVPNAFETGGASQ
jgi:rubrerythrin